MTVPTSPAKGFSELRKAFSGELLGKRKEPQVIDPRLLRFSEGDGTRTRNHRIDRRFLTPPCHCRKSLETRAFRAL